MGRNRTIQYAVDLDTGLVYSRFDGEIAVPVLDFAGMRPDNGWAMNYNLEKFPPYAVRHAQLKWTRKISLETKNLHREFWGMKPLKGGPDVPET